jgi:hypothetical protein
MDRAQGAGRSPKAGPAGFESLAVRTMELLILCTVPGWLCLLYAVALVFVGPLALLRLIDLDD